MGLLFFGSEPLDRVLAGPHLSVQREDQAVVGTGVSQRLQCRDNGEVVGASSSQRLGDGQPLDPEIGAFLPRAFEPIDGPVAFGQLTAGKLANGLPEFALFIGLLKVHRLPSVSRFQNAGPGSIPPARTRLPPDH